MKYRDTKTGQFVSAATWRRSRAHGGTRYRRVNRTGPRLRVVAGKRPTVSAAAPPSTELQREFIPVRETIPIEFLESADEFFESGYESEEEEEYP